VFDLRVSDSMTGVDATFTVAVKSTFDIFNITLKLQFLLKTELLIIHHLCLILAWR
jgi:hypothetical protein